MDMSIPKIIHYVWVGNNKKPKDVEKCIKTWKKYLPEYKIIEWNEKNFNIDSNEFVKKAYENKKWAFVSDYIRMYAIYNHGGIYFDTDVLVLENLDFLLKNKCFVGFETNEIPFTAVFGAEKGNEFIEKIIKKYDDMKDCDFEPKDANTILVKNILIEEYNCKLGNIEQNLIGGIKVYKKEILCKPSISSKTIHVFTASWIDGKKRWINKLDRKFRMNLTNKINVLLYIPFKFFIINSKKIAKYLMKILNKNYNIKKI